MPRVPEPDEQPTDGVPERAGQPERDLVEQLELATLALDALAHDVRTRLTVISGMASTLREPRASRLSDAERDEWLARIASNAERIETILTNLLDLQRDSAGELPVRRSPIDSVALVRRVVHDLDLRDHPIEAPAGEVVAAIDPFLLERIVENLINNAVRHTPSGTAVRVRVTALPGALELAVDDDGPGIAADRRDVIFERFRTDGSANPGLGLGLSLVKRLAMLHGGDAWLEDGSAGASFRVRVSTDGPSAADPPRSQRS